METAYLARLVLRRTQTTRQNAYRSLLRLTPLALGATVSPLPRVPLEVSVQVHSALPALLHAVPAADQHRTIAPCALLGHIFLTIIASQPTMMEYVRGQME